MSRYGTNLVRRADQLILPIGGGWVCVRGSPMAPRGNRIEPSHREEGIRHFDIYWAYDEECPWNVKSPQLRPPDHWEPWEQIHQIQSNLGITSAQLTWMTLHTPSSKLIRMWSGEVRHFTEDLIELLMLENQLEVISFAGENPVWMEETRDMVGSLMLDGLSLSQAQHELITARSMRKSEAFKPPWFYRVRRDSFTWHQFCEEPEYEAWWAPGKDPYDQD